MEKNILIADAGSTKTDWALISQTGRKKKIYTSSGLNPVTLSDSEFKNILSEVKSVFISGEDISEIFFYGAGCATTEICKNVSEHLNDIFHVKKIRVESDLLGAVRSSLGRTEGIVCILGTGSNSCHCKNGEIINRIPAMGFILGDEGSGASLGKRFLNKIYKDKNMSDILREFEADLNLDLPKIIEKVYKSSSPNYFLASIVPYIIKKKEDPRIKKIIYEELESFLYNNLYQYSLESLKNIYFVGSLARVFEKELKKICKYDFKLSQKPIDGLINYHCIK